MKINYVLSYLLISFFILLIPVLIFLGFHKQWQQENCKWKENYGIVKSVFYDSGLGKHYYVLDVDGIRINSYEPYEIGDKYIFSEEIVSCP